MESSGGSAPTPSIPAWGLAWVGLARALGAQRGAVHKLCAGLGRPGLAHSSGVGVAGGELGSPGAEGGPGQAWGWGFSTGAVCPSAPVQDIVFQLQRLVSTMSKYYNDCYAVLRDADVFPIEVDLAHTTLAYGLGQEEFTDGEEEEDEDDEDTAAGEPSRDARGAAGPLDKGGSWCDS